MLGFGSLISSHFSLFLTPLSRRRRSSLVALFGPSRYHSRAPPSSPRDRRRPSLLLESWRSSSTGGQGDPRPAADDGRTGEDLSTGKPPLHHHALVSARGGAVKREHGHGATPACACAYVVEHDLSDGRRRREKCSRGSRRCSVGVTIARGRRTRVVRALCKQQSHQCSESPSVQLLTDRRPARRFRAHSCTNVQPADRMATQQHERQRR